MIRVTVDLNGTPVDYDHPTANGFYVHNDGDVEVRTDDKPIAMYLNRYGGVLRVVNVEADTPKS